MKLMTIAGQPRSHRPSNSNDVDSNDARD